MGYTRRAVAESNGGLEDKLDIMINLLSNVLSMIKRKRIVATPEGLVEILVDPMDKALGELAEDRGRGR